VAAAPVNNPARLPALVPVEPAPKPAPQEPAVLTPRVALPVKNAWRRPVAGTKAIQQIALEVPPELRSTIDSKALVDVAVVIDEKGKVTEAKVNSTTGESASLLAAEALKAARRFRFRPALDGKKPVQSQTVLNFVFDPEP
jgi:TonB family protein